MKIVCNIKAQANAEAGVLVARATPAWVGCTFSNGVECTEEIANALVSGVDLETFAPPLLIDHECKARGIVGKMISIELQEGKVVIDFAVTDPKAIENIVAGTWENVSLSFEEPSYKIIETSIVAVPAIPGAKIKPAGELTEEACKKETLNEEEKPCEVNENPAEAPAEDTPMAEPATKEAPVSPEEAREELMAARAEDTPAEEAPAEPASAEEKPAEQNSIVENSRLRAEVTKLQKQVKELNAQITFNSRQKVAEGLVNDWLTVGLTTPVNATKETAFLIELQAVSNSLLEKYKELKGSAPCANVLLGGRKSVANAKAMSHIEELNEMVVNQRLQRRSEK